MNTTSSRKRVLLLVVGFLVAASPSSSQTTGIVDGRSKLFYESIGRGLETIVVLHGGPGLAHDYMRPEWDRLALSGRVIYYDQNGCGQSGRVPPYGWRSHVEDLDRLLGALAPDKRVVLAGSSWGSLLALAYAYYYPDRVKALILSGVPFGSTRSGSESSPPWAPPWVAPSRRRLDSVNRGLTVGPSRPRPPLEPRLQRRINEDCSDVGAIISTSLLDAPWLSQLRTISAPALVIHGSKPGQSPGDGGPRLAGTLPNAKLVTIQDAGHDPWLDQPNAFFSAANAFVTRLRMSATPSPPLKPRESKMFRVPSKDGTLIAVECAGSGPTLIIVHGGVGDRTRWTPMFPLLSSRFTVCAMDRRGHGLSGDSPNYSLQKEAEDVASVVDSRRGTVFVLGHSYGGVSALEAMFLTKQISRLILYEPPVQEPVERDLAIAGKMERMIRDGAREQAAITFFTEVVQVTPAEVARMKARPAWAELVSTIDTQLRQMHALAGYRFDAKRMNRVRQPTLLLLGGETTSPYLKQSINSLRGSLPNATRVLLNGQQHNAMETGRDMLASAIIAFLLGGEE